jgi:multicomponent Na+:H+ antiporter subunit D
MLTALLDLAPEALRYHSPVLVAVVPLLSAAICAVLPGPRVAWVWAVLVTIVTVGLSLLLLAQTPSGSIVSYALGGWAPPVGIEFRADSLNALVATLVAVMGCLVLVASFASIRDEIRADKTPMFLAAFLLCLAGLLGVTLTGDAFNLFVFLEVNAITTYVLVAMGASRDRRALPAAFNYLIMGSIGATFYVIGVGFIYAATGTLNMADIARIATPIASESSTVQAGFAFMIVGLGLKAAMFPLHQWLPNAYTYAPSFVTAFLAATATKVALYALIRVAFTLFDPAIPFERLFFTWVLAPMGAAAVIACSIQAVFQTNVKRMLAYSSVAQIGYMLIGVALTTQAGLGAAVLHLVNHSLMKAALFIAIAAVLLRGRTATLAGLAGIGKQAPVTATALGVAALSLIGVPLTAGFVSKWALLQASLAEGWLWAVAVIAIGSLLALLYGGRILEAVFFKAVPEDAPVMREAPPLMLAVLIGLALANLWFGIDAGLTTSLSSAAAGAIIGPGELATGGTP